MNLEERLAKYDESNLEEDLDNRNYRCNQCKHFGTWKNPCTKRIDHESVRFAIPWFKSYDYDFGTVCREFKPAKWCRWDYKYWMGFDEYFTRHFPLSTWYKKENPLVWFTLNGDTSVRYGVKLMDYINGTMYTDDMKLKAVKKVYYKKSRKSPIGYELITECIENPVDIYNINIK